MTRAAVLAVLLALVVAPGAAAQERVLLTGDSMMEVLQRRLAPDLRALGHEVQTDARVGSALTKPWVVDWLRHAPRQVERIRPTLTIVWLGAGDVHAFRGVARCCGDAWVAAYAGRVRRLTTTYGRALWLTLPAPAWPKLARVHRAVNRALHRSGVPLVDLAARLAPHDRFHPRMRWDGVVRTIRARDGVHLSPWGSIMASAIIADALGQA